MRPRPRRASRPLRFNLSRKEYARQGGSSVVILIGGSIFCVATVLFFNVPERLAATGSDLRGSIVSDEGGTASIEASPVAPTGQLAVAQRPAPNNALPHEAHFSLCGKVRHNCVVDGDTFWAQGKKIRIVNIDTPETSRARCREERALGIRATRRLLELLNQGPFHLVPPRDGRDRDRYGRVLRHVERDGASIGEQLVAEGLARNWEGRRKSWCGD